MKSHVLAILFLVTNFFVSAQSKMGDKWVIGCWRATDVEFNGNNPAKLNLLYDSSAAPSFPYYYTWGHSNICDSATGNLLFSTTGMLIHDTSGAIMDNGDSLVDNEYYSYSFYPSIDLTQGSIILPKGSNTGQYYLIIPTISDSAWNYYWPLGGAIPYDQILVNVIDMNLNNGLGKVIVKKKKLLQGAAIHKTMMQACRHSNGADWWLLKQGEYDTNRIYRYLVKADTIEGPWIQSFPEPKYTSLDLTGQYAFSPDGKKFASVQGTGAMNKLFLADFDRCTGELSNASVVNIPIDSTTIPFLDNAGDLDSINRGVCFSANGQFIYLSKNWNIYQYEYQQSDSSLAWYRVQHGMDTTYQQFQLYGHLARGIDGKIYIGYPNGLAREWSIIVDPNNKGFNCNFCRKCFRNDTISSFFTLTAPPNMPDYTLGPEPGPCWPLESSGYLVVSSEVEVYPNPVSGVLNIKTESPEPRELYNAIGQMIQRTLKNEMDVSQLPPGVYYIRCGVAVKKVVIE